MTSLYGEKVGVSMAETFIKMDTESIKNIVHDCASVNLVKLSESEQQCCIFCYGSKEFDLKGAKRLLPEFYQHATLRVWKGYEHCEKITQDTLEDCAFLSKEISASNVLK